jgi:protein phosphatase 1G
LLQDTESARFVVGASSMQGWRVTQEDAHNAILDYDTDSGFFAVYDGHGGSEVAEYTSRKLPAFIKKNIKYTEGSISDVSKCGTLRNQ